MTTVRVYLRRSRGDDGHQEFSLDTQRDGAERFVAGALAGGHFAEDWHQRVEYIDDDRAGDDFEGRERLIALRAEVQPGDIVVCRDQSRIGRDALTTAYWIRELIQTCGARLFYYDTGEEVAFGGAVDALVAVARGTGAQFELEAIRSRTREGIRARVRDGKVAGGTCYGYRNERRKDDGGREFTLAVVHPGEAEVVRRIYSLYLDGSGYSGIAKILNAEGVLSPVAGKRGCGVWTHSSINEMLKRPRYRGLYVHGLTNRKRQGGKRKAERADPLDVLEVELPEWQIVDDITWFSAQEDRAKRSPKRAARKPGEKARAPAAKFALSGLGRCSNCGHGIGVHNTKISGGKRVRAYVCTGYQKKGKTVCDVNLRQPMAEVDEALAGYLRDTVLTPVLLDQLMVEIDAEIERELAQPPVDMTVVADKLRQLRAEQGRLAKAVAISGDIPELVKELQRRSQEIQRLEGERVAAQRAPEKLREVMAKVKAAAVAKLDDLHVALAADPSGAREVYKALFPEGLQFNASRKANRRVWAISGIAHLGSSNLCSDPTGT